MGRDKALIKLRGRFLWEHQLATLRQTLPQELFISGPANAGYRSGDAQVVTDLQADQGPLVGITSVLQVIGTEWLLVLPVDVPNMSSALLESLLREVARVGRGVVPVHEDGRLEPLVAVYPRAALPYADALLQAGERKLSVFVDQLERAELIAKAKLPPEVARQFANWNSPEDVAPFE